MVWLLDEPHAGLDTSARVELDRLLREATMAGATVVYTTHELEQPGRSVPRTVTLVGGVIASDTPGSRAT
jgi:ABC-type Mn2+/Zn2+ transport system ATPase subunit